MTGDGLPEPGSYFYVLLVSYSVIYGEMLASVRELGLLGSKQN